MGDKGSEIRIFLADTGEEVAMAKDAQIHLSPTDTAASGGEAH